MSRGWSVASSSWFAHTARADLWRRALVRQLLDELSHLRSPALPIVDVVIPRSGGAPGFRVSHRLVDDMVGQTVGDGPAALLVGEEPEVLVVLAPAAQQLEADARDRVVESHGLAAVDQHAESVVDITGVLRARGHRCDVGRRFHPCVEGVEIEIPDRPRVGSVLPGYPAECPEPEGIG